MKNPVLILLGMVLAFSACNKGENADPKANSADSAYFFKFTFADSQYYLKSVLPDNVLWYPNELRGVQIHGGSEVPLITLTVSYAANHLVTDADVRALKDQTIYFGGGSRISFLRENNGTVWHSVSGRAEIYDVTFIEGQTLTGQLVLVHAIRGTCYATMSDGTNTTTLTNASFNLPVAVLAR